jgi:adenosylmethionine-8-amino-7-oxononanoate aminotransferase
MSVMDHVFYSFPGEKPTESIVEGKGMYLYADNGKEYLDFTAGSTHNSILGFNHEYVLDAVSTQLKKICNIDFKNWIDDNRTELAGLIAAEAPAGLNKLFFTGQSGSEACEAALQLSFQSHVERGLKDKVYFISRRESYHGATTSSMVCGDRLHLKYMEELWPKNHIKISAHDPLHGPAEGETPDEYLESSIAEFQAAIDQVGADRVAAFIGEPIMGGLQGDIPPHPEYWRRISEICSRNEIHLILDEIYTGTGISGRYFCCERDEGVSPDFVLLGKTLGAGYAPISAVMTTDAIEETIRLGSGRVSYSSTHQGHSLSVAAALAAQKLILETGLVTAADVLGEHMMDVIRAELQDDDFFISTHGRGLRFSLEYASTDNVSLGNEIRNRLKDEHQIIIDAKWHRIGFRPPMICTQVEADKALEIILKLFKSVTGRYQPSFKAKLYA